MCVIYIIGVFNMRKIKIISDRAWVVSLAFVGGMGMSQGMAMENETQNLKQIAENYDIYLDFLSATNTFVLTNLKILPLERKREASEPLKVLANANSIIPSSILANLITQSEGQPMEQRIQVIRDYMAQNGL